MVPLRRTPGAGPTWSESTSTAIDHPAFDVLSKPLVCSRVSHRILESMTMASMQGTRLAWRPQIAETTRLDRIQPCRSPDVKATFRVMARHEIRDQSFSQRERRRRPSEIGPRLRQRCTPERRRVLDGTPIRQVQDTSTGPRASNITARREHREETLRCSGVQVATCGTPTHPAGYAS